MSGQRKLNIVRRIRQAKNKLLSRTIYYKREKRDAGEIARDIRIARKSNATKKYKDAIKVGYNYFGKAMPKRVDKRTPSKLPKDIGRGWGG